MHCRVFPHQVMGLLLFILCSSFGISAAQANQCSAEKIKACAAINTSYQRSCASSLPNRGTQREMWFKRVSAFATTHKMLMSKKSVADQCVACGKLHANWERDCARQQKKVSAQWSGHISDLSKSSYQFQSVIKANIRRTNHKNNLKIIDAELSRLEETKKINASAQLKADTSALDKRAQQLQTLRGSEQKAHNKIIARERCPKKGKKNKKHFKTVKAFLLKDPKYAKQLKQLRVVGRSAKNYKRWKRTTYETLPLSTCVRAKRANKPDRCYVMEMSVQRTKIDGQSWSGWDTVLVGAQIEMLCKHLR